METIKAQFAFDTLEGDHDIYHFETQVDQIVDFQENVNAIVNQKIEKITVEPVFVLPTVDSGLINAIWIDTSN